MKPFAFVVFLALACPATAAGQDKAPASAAAVPASTAAAATPGKPVEKPPAPPADYQYDAAGRRDPFISLVNRGSETSRSAKAVQVRPEGLGGIGVDDVVVKGIVQNRGGWVAMIGSPSGRTYSIRPGDRLFDGAVRTITAQAVVLMQEVNDPLKLEKQREVRKYLRGEVK